MQLKIGDKFESILDGEIYEIVGFADDVQNGNKLVIHKKDGLWFGSSVIYFIEHFHKIEE